MTKKSFDDIIRAKLSGFHSSSQADWHAFEQMMSERNTELSDKSFDTQLARKLNTHGTTAPEGSWESFSQRHKLVLHLQSNLKSLKLVEACIILLMLFIFTGPVIHFYSQATAENSTIEIKPTHGIELTTGEFNGKELKEVLVTDPGKGLKWLSGDLDYDARIKLSKREEQADATTKTINKKLAAIPINNTTEDKASREELGHDLYSLNTTKAISKEITELISLQRIENLKAVPLKIREDLEFLDIPFAPIRIYTDQRLDADFISFYSAFDNNLIHTPDDLEYNTEARKTEMFGYSLGLMYSRKRGAFEWLTGLMYSSLDKPWDFTLQYGNSNGWYSFIMTNLHFKMAALPMELNYHLVENREWSLIARLGLMHSFIMSSQYQTSNSFLGGGSFLPGDEIPDPGDGFSPFENERAFTEGLLQGGALRDNYFMRSYLGAGIQRNISPEVAINFSAAYHRNIINTTIGPNKDRLDKFEISFGLKLRLP